MYNSNGQEKNPEDRVRRNPETYVIDAPKWNGTFQGPILPKSIDWCEETKEWWKTWRKSDQSMLMTATDWQFMLDTAILHNMLWDQNAVTGAVSVTQLAGEIRQRVAKMGATYEDRKKLRMAISCPQTEADAKNSALSGEVDSVYEDMFANLRSKFEKK